MTTPYVSQQPVDDFGLRFSDILYSAILPVSTNAVIIVPGIAPTYKAIIRSTAEVWVALNAVNSTANLPLHPTPPSDEQPLSFIQSTNSELVCGCCAVCREVSAGDVLCFATNSSTATDVSVVFYTLRTNS